jgi:hypothetical protein
VNHHGRGWCSAAGALLASAYRWSPEDFSAKGIWKLAGQHNNRCARARSMHIWLMQPWPTTHVAAFSWWEFLRVERTHSLYIRKWQLFAVVKPWVCVWVCEPPRHQSPAASCFFSVHRTAHATCTHQHTARNSTRHTHSDDSLHMRGHFIHSSGNRSAIKWCTRTPPLRPDVVNSVVHGFDG